MKSKPAVLLCALLVALTTVPVLAADAPGQARSSTPRRVESDATQIGTGDQWVNGKLGVNAEPGAFILDANQGSTNGLRISAGGALGIELATLASGTLTRLLSFSRSGGNYGDFFIEHATGGTGTIFKANGRIGIGTSDPGAMLHVAGDGYVTGNLGVGSLAGNYSLDVSQAGTGGFRVSNAGALGIELAAETATRSRLLSYDRTSPGTYADFFVEHATDARGTIFKSNGDVELGVQPSVTNPTLPNVTLKVNGNIEATGTIYAKFQDVAEWVPATEAIPPGTVVVVAARNHVTPSAEPYDTRVAGVVSPQPGLVLGEAGESKVLVATTGRVKVRVDASNGAIREGDLLVSSPLKGVAMKSEPVVLNGRRFHQPGTVIGKALERLDKGTGEILVLLSLQ